MIASSERLMHSEALVEELKDQSHDLASRKSQLVLPLSPAVVARLNRPNRFTTCNTFRRQHLLP